MEYKGRIESCYFQRGFGFIKAFYTSRDIPPALHNNSIFFHLTEYRGEGLQKDLIVSFSLGRNQKGPVAVDVKKLEKRVI
jgi:cold shock CspA family protein